MREVITMQFGQAGNTLGKKFWGSLCEEHKIDPVGHYGGEDSMEVEKADVFFKESITGRFVPRCLLIDLAPESLDQIQNSDVGSLFGPFSFISGLHGAGNNFAKAFYGEGKILCEATLDKLRIETEDCDGFQGFQVLHALGGGTGSGLVAAVANKITNEYPENQSLSYSIFPSPKVSEVVVEPYNAILGVHHLIENMKQCVMIDNNALFDIAHEIFTNTPTFEEFNYIACEAMLGITAPFRFPHVSSVDMRKMAVNLIPFPRYHFFTLSQCPLMKRENMKYQQFQTRLLTTRVLSPTNTLIAMDLRKCKYIAAHCVFRGEFSNMNIDTETLALQHKFSNNFVKCYSRHIHSCIIERTPLNFPRSATFVGNSTGTADILTRICSVFDKMHDSKAFTHWFTQAGLDGEAMTEARYNIMDLVAEYESFDT